MKRRILFHSAIMENLAGPQLENVSTVLLDDLPATQDSFGPHKRIADAIGKLVSNEPGGKAIALVGTWGGGKSTVINLLKGSKKADLEFFVFDAWAHQGDPLRRTFLEKLIAFLAAPERQWISAKDWKRRVDELSKRYKESTTTSTPQLTKLGTLCGVLIFFEAIGLAMISAGFDSKWWNSIGFLLTLLPPIILVIIWLTKRGQLPRDRRGDADNLLGYLINKQTETVKTATVEAPEPTSVEFQSWFHHVAEEALRSDRKLVLVIDNLDRVDPDDALQLWAAMRTFVDFSGSDTPSWTSRLWAIVAFDENGIKRLWKNEQEAVDSPAVSFLDKTFQIRFRIPAPLLSDWRSFLNSQLKRAFPQASDPELYNVSQVYAIRVAEKKAPTPRDIKVFVNQIGAVFRTSPESIPLPQQALYVLLEGGAWDPFIDIRDFSRIEPYLGSGWDENKLALYYNMPRQNAIEVVLGGEVEKSVAQAKPDLLANFVKTPGIGVVVGDVLEKRIGDWYTNEPRVLGRAAYVLDASGLDGKYSTQIETRLFRELRRVSNWSQLDKDGAKGIATVIPSNARSQIT